MAVRNVCSQIQEEPVVIMWCIYTSIEHFWTILCIEKVTLFQHEQTVYYPLALAVVMLPSSVWYLWCFCLFLYLMSAYCTNQKSQKRSHFSSLVRGPLMHLLPRIFVSSVVPLSVECCAQLALFPPFQFGASFLKNKVQGSIIGCIISSISCLISLEHRQICLTFPKSWPKSCAN